MASPRRHTFSINCATKLNNWGHSNKKGGGCTLKAVLDGPLAGFCDAHEITVVSKFMTVAEIEEYQRQFRILVANARAIQNTPGPLAIAPYDAAKTAVSRHREAFLLAQHTRRENLVDAEKWRMDYDMVANYMPVFLDNYNRRNPTATAYLSRATLPPVGMTLDEAVASKVIDTKSAGRLRDFLNDHRKSFCFCLTALIALIAVIGY
jgi:hypothetical protein